MLVRKIAQGHSAAARKTAIVQQLVNNTNNHGKKRYFSNNLKQNYQNNQNQNTPRHYKIGVIEGDGIGTEVVPEAVEVLKLLGHKHNFSMEFENYPYSCKYYLEHGTMLPSSALESFATKSALFLGAVGDPRLVRDDISLRGLLLPIRTRFDLFVNLRPSKTLTGISTPLMNMRTGKPAKFDVAVVRENSEGEYAGMGGRFRQGTADETALQTSVFTRKGIERIIRFAFELAITRAKASQEQLKHDSSTKRRTLHVTLATKSNAMQYGFVLWDEIFDQIAAQYSSAPFNVTSDKFHIDALAAKIITHPEHFDVIVASNLFGDILTDLMGALQGSLGLPASANINPSREYPCLFESVHGSAPDIAGHGIANPIATFQAAAMMLEWLGETSAANSLSNTIEQVIADPVNMAKMTPDIGGKGNTRSCSDVIMQAVASTSVIKQ